MKLTILLEKCEIRKYMLNNVKDYIKKHQMLQQNDRVILGISGGADSVCLLFVLLELRKEYNLELVGVHVNHNLRGEEALRDQRYVEEICKKYEVPLTIVSVDVSQRAKIEKLSFEEAGRNVRREAFEQEAKKAAGSKIATAHHQNDNAETFLINLVRGTGIRGLKGIAPVRGQWIRPLLGVSRTEVEAYLLDKGVEYCIDSTNLEDDYTRNLVRNQVIPILENSMNAQAIVHMNSAIEELAKIDAYLEMQLDSMWQICVCENDVINIEMMNRYPVLLQEKLCKRVLEQAAGESRDITRTHILQMLELKQKQVGKQINLPYGLMAKRGYVGIVIETDSKKENLNIEGIELEIPGETLLADGCCVVTSLQEINDTWLEKNSPEEINENSYTKYFDYDIIKDVLRIRGRCTGDEIVINKNGNRQTLKKFFINQKIPQEDREKKRLLVEGNKVLWAIGLRKSEGYNITKETKRILKVQLNGGNYGRNN